MTVDASLPSTLTCPALPGVKVLPVLRGRLTCAWAAARHVQAAAAGTVIAADLPHPLEQSEWLAAALDALPSPSSLIVHDSTRNRVLPFVANDAACLALRTAARLGFRHACVDDAMPAALPDPGGVLPDDESLPGSLEEYFSSAWAPLAGVPISPRAARVGRRLRRLAAIHGSVLFICEWRLWPLVAAAATQDVFECEPEPYVSLPAAVVPEDALLLWQTGHLDDFPAASLAALSDSGQPPSKLRLLRALALLGGVSLPVASTLSIASGLLEPVLEQQGESVSSQLAAEVLSCPVWTLADLEAGAMPQFGRFTGGGITPEYDEFDLQDLLACEPLYPRSSAETARFFPPREACLRKYWGPGPMQLTRAEAGVRLSGDHLWSVRANYRAMSAAAEILRAEAGRLAPDSVTDVFTPVAWMFATECDGAFKSIIDSNPAHRRSDLAALPQSAAQYPADGGAPDFIHTLVATRSESGPLCPGLSYDLAGQIGLVYSGPEGGPDRYRIVTESGRPVPRIDPNADPELAGFEVAGGQRCLAFCVRYATSVVLLAHCPGFRISVRLADYARQRAVTIIPMPLTVMPPYLQIAVRRRVFSDTSLRFISPYADRIADRAVFWRQPPGPDARERARE